MNDDAGGRRRLRRMWLPRTGLLATVAGAALLTAACGGGSTNSAQVASLPTSSGHSASSGTGSGNSTTTGSTGNAAQLLAEWAACMRSHGDTSQATPTIDANKVIHIAILPSVSGGINGTQRGGVGNVGPGQYCGTYLNNASNTLRGNQPLPTPPDLTDQVKYAACMRANGVQDYPDPSPGGVQLSAGGGGDLNPDSPAFMNATKECVKQTGVHPLVGAGPLPAGSILYGPPGGGTAALVPVSGGGPGANG